MSAPPASPSAAPPARAWWGTPLRVLLILAGASPFVPRWVRGIPGLEHVGTTLDAWFAFQCHRESARSMVVFGDLLPVCSRCAGIYVGLGLGAALLRPRLGVWPLRIWVGFAALVMILDVATETLGMRPELGSFRFTTGAFLSFPVAVAVVLSALPDPA